MTTLKPVAKRDRAGTVEALSSVAPHLADEFLAIYRAAFSPLELLSPARQVLADDEFLTAMHDESVIKFVGWDKEHMACAMAVIATDLSSVPWVSVPYFAARYPDQHGRRAIYYFHALLVRPELQGGPWARLMLEELTRAMAAIRAVAAFDCCGHTVRNARLPEVIARVAGRLVHLEPEELDQQHYFAYGMNGMR